MSNIFIVHVSSKTVQQKLVEPQSIARTVKVGAFGCGVDSVAGLLHYGLDSYDEIIFADTGSEKFQTYEYLAYLINQKGWDITVLSSKYGNIYDYYKKKKLYPNMFRKDCVGKFKIDVINGYLRKKYGRKAHFITTLFIDYGEFSRVRPPKYKYQTLLYPMVDDKIDREKAIEIILQHGFPVPIKSGCFFCPFTKPAGWIWLRDNNPEEFKQASELEAISTLRKKREYPLISLKGHESSTLIECGCFNG